MFFKCILNRQLARTVVSASRSKTKDKRLSEQRLVTHELLDSIDISWYRILENEFSKEYFKKVWYINLYLLWNTLHCLNSWLNSLLINEWNVWLFILRCSKSLHLHDCVNQMKWKLLFLDKIHIINLIKHIVSDFQIQRTFRFQQGLSVTFRSIHLEYNFSLQNIFKEVQNDLSNFIIPKHGTLFGWARQGVLLLNTCLTVEENRANSHKNKGWEIFTVCYGLLWNFSSRNIHFLG